MKKLMFGLVTLFMLCFANYNKVVAQDAEPEDPDLTWMTPELVEAEMRTGIFGFVNAVKEALPAEEYSDFEDFRQQLLGESNISTITSEGNQLLETTYQFIQTNASEEDIKDQGWQTYAAAMKVVLEAELEADFSGSQLITGSIQLWGGNLDGILQATPEDPQDPASKCPEYRDCKWYQFGCHGHNIATWICNNADAAAKIIVGVLDFLKNFL